MFYISCIIWVSESVHRNIILKFDLATSPKEDKKSSNTDGYTYIQRKEKENTCMEYT